MHDPAPSLLMGGAGLAAGLFLTGKTLGEIRKDTRTIVEYEDRRDKIKAVLKRWEDEVKRLDKTRNKSVDELVALIQRHDAKPTDFDPSFAAFDEIRRRRSALRSGCGSPCASTSTPKSGVGCSHPTQTTHRL